MSFKRKRTSGCFSDVLVYFLLSSGPTALFMWKPSSHNQNHFQGNQYNTNLYSSGLLCIFLINTETWKTLKKLNLFEPYNVAYSWEHGSQDTVRRRCWKREVAQEVTEASLGLERRWCSYERFISSCSGAADIFGTGFQPGLVVLTSRLEKGLGSGLLRKISLR